MPATAYKKPPAKPKPFGDGRAQHKSSPKGVLHTDFTVDYARQEAPVDLFKQQFKVLARAAGATFDISTACEEVTWSDDSANDLVYVNEQPSMQGTIQLRKPALNQYKQLLPSLFESSLTKADDGMSRWGALGVVIVLEVGYGGHFVPLWAMRVTPGQGTQAEQMTMSDGEWLLTLADDLTFLDQSVDDFKFTKGKKTRKKGWRCDQITAAVCQQYAVPVKQLSRGTAYFDLPTRTTTAVSPLTVIANAYQEETNRTGKAFIVRWAAPTAKWPLGALEVVPLRRNPNLLKFRKQLTEAILTRSQSTDFATVVEGRATLKHGKVSTGATATGSTRQGGPVYMLGDSIFAGAAPDMTASAKQQGWTATVDGVVSRPLTTGVSILQSAPAALNRAAAVVIELGTNDSGDSAAYTKQVAQAVAAVRKTNPNAPLFWVNLFSGVSQKAAYNAVLRANPDITVIDAESAGISLGGDGIHPDSAGDKTLATLIAQSLGGSATSGSSGGPHLKYIATNERAVRRFGYVHKIIDFNPVSSALELQIMSKRALASRLVPLRTAELTHPGIATLRRGDAIRIDLPEEGYAPLALNADGTPSGKKSKQTALALQLAEAADPSLFGLPDSSALFPSATTTTQLKHALTADVAVRVPVADQGIAFVTTVSHTLTSTSYSMDFLTSFVDILDPVSLQAEIAANIRAAKSLGRKTKTTPTGGGNRWHVIASAEVSGGTGSCRPIQDDGYSELSTVPMGTSSDFAALGSLPCLLPMKITNPANGRTVTTVKQDVGAGSSFLPVMGLYPATVSALGLSGGEFHVIIERADGAPLHPVRGTPA